jgi:uncharacterized protein YciI
MTIITDEYIQEMLAKSKEYAMVILKPGPKSDMEGAKEIIWEHVRRNFALSEDGQLSIVGPVTAETGVSGLSIFDTTIDEAKRIMDDDPAVQAGIFIYEVHPWRSFPGDKLPD